MANHIQVPLESIIPQLKQTWQIKYTQHIEQLDTEWQQLREIEVVLLRILEQGWEGYTHDLLFLCLDRVRQKMTEVMLEIEHGPNWIFNGYGGDNDK